MAEKKAQVETPVEYEEITTMDIMFPGPVNWWEATPEMLRELADSYDPTFLRAPIVADHRMEGPAFGHVLDVEFIEGETDKDDFTLRAEVGLFESGKFMIESGGWNERSVLIDDNYPMPGIFYLRHLSLLGAANPAIPGMDLIILPPLDEADEADGAEVALIPAGYKQMAAAVMMAVWDKTEEYVRYRVRPPSRFKDDTFRTVTLSKKKGIQAIQGKLKPKFVPKGKKPDAMVMHVLLFERGKGWDLAKAQKWVKGKQKTLSAWVEEDERLVPKWGAEIMGQSEPLSASDIAVIKGRKSVEVDSTVADKIPSLTAKAGGGKGTMSGETDLDKKVDPQTPETKPKPTEPEPGDVDGEVKSEDDADLEAAQVTLIQTDSIDDLRAQNLKLLTANRASKVKALKVQTALRSKLRKEESATRLTIIDNAVDELMADGYIIPAQKHFGLAAALNHIPDEAVIEIDEVEVKAIDAILECLKMGGRLKLKGEVATEEKAIPTAASPRADKLATSTVKVVGLDMLRRIDELQAENPEMDYITAYEQAGREAGGGL